MQIHYPGSDNGGKGNVHGVSDGERMTEGCWPNGVAQLHGGDMHIHTVLGNMHGRNLRMHTLGLGRPFHYDNRMSRAPSEPAPLGWGSIRALCVPHWTCVHVHIHYAGHSQ